MVNVCAEAILEQGKKVLTDMLEKHHMEVPWHTYSKQGRKCPITEATLEEKASIIGRVGLIMLSCGTGAWRVRSSMNTLARQLGVTCTANIGLMDIGFNCYDGERGVSRNLCLPNTGVNTYKLYKMVQYVSGFHKHCLHKTGEEIHQELDRLNRTPALYSPLQLGLASALACGGFTFLLGGGVPEILLAFLAAGFGNFVRSSLIRSHFTLFLNIALAVVTASVVYTLGLWIGETWLHVAPVHQAGYICGMLFLIPGFPFITSGIDLSKLDLRSGLERLAYALLIILVATLTGWGMARILGLRPLNFVPLGLAPDITLALRLVASFCGVFGFSIMFNSPAKLAATAGLFGAVANTLRLELVDLAGFPASGAAFLGALTAGLLASAYKKHTGYPRIAQTVPSIVIMVPGLYLYRAIYHLGGMALDQSASWFASAGTIIMALPLGLIAARILTDRNFRYSS